MQNAIRCPGRIRLKLKKIFACLCSNDEVVEKSVRMAQHPRANHGRGGGAVGDPIIKAHKRDVDMMRDLSKRGKANAIFSPEMDYSARKAQAKGKGR